jgi:Cys-tRNA(Pro)/Cys-tRNA(Cys) deacylase
MSIQNNVTRFLESQGIPFSTHELPVEKLSALEVAQYLHVPPELVYKTIVIVRKGTGKPILAVIPGPNEVNLKALARLIKEKKVILTTQREAEQLTGLQAGGISPLALMNRGFQTIIDSSALILEEIYISGGQRGLDITLSPQALIDITKALVADVKKEKVGGK